MSLHRHAGAEVDQAVALEDLHGGPGVDLGEHAEVGHHEDAVDCEPRDALGFKAVEQLGTEHRDELTPSGFKGNAAGGVLGGISSGQDVLVSVALKPTSSLRIPAATIDQDGQVVKVATHGRHDPCVGLRATPIAEAMLAIVLMDHYLRQRAQNADVEADLIDIEGSPGPTMSDLKNG